MSTCRFSRRPRRWFEKTPADGFPLRISMVPAAVSERFAGNPKINCRLQRSSEVGSRAVGLDETDLSFSTAITKLVIKQVQTTTNLLTIKSEFRSYVLAMQIRVPSSITVMGIVWPNHGCLVTPTLHHIY